MPLPDEGYGAGTPCLPEPEAGWFDSTLPPTDERQGMSEETPADEERRLRGEGELTSMLIMAAKDSDGPLSQQEIDELLGVDGEGE
jgi:hypothetical protein